MNTQDCGVQLQLPRQMVPECHLMTCTDCHWPLCEGVETSRRQDGEAEAEKQREEDRERITEREEKTNVPM